MDRTILVSVEPTTLIAIDQEHPQGAVEFKTLKHLRDSVFGAVEEKRLRAIFDPDLGSNGGYRCPPGTANAGQWTDKFGRNCGGASRRIGNAVGAAARAATSTALPPRKRRSSTTGATVTRTPARATPAATPSKPSTGNDRLFTPSPLPPRRRSSNSGTAAVQRTRTPVKPTPPKPKPTPSPLPARRRSNNAARRTALPSPVPKPTPVVPNKRPPTVKRPPKRTVSGNQPVPALTPAQVATAIVKPGRASVSKNRIKLVTWAKLSPEEQSDVAKNAFDEYRRLRTRWGKRLGQIKAWEDQRADILDYVDKLPDGPTKTRLETEANDIINLQDYGISVGINQVSPTMRARLLHRRPDLTAAPDSPVDPVEEIVPEPPKAKPAIRWPGSMNPKVRQLQDSDFDSEDKTLFMDSRVAMRERGAAMIEDMAIDLDELQGTLADLGTELLDMQNERSRLEKDLLDPTWWSVNPDEVHAAQVRYHDLKGQIHELEGFGTALGERVQYRQGVEAFDEFQKIAVDPNNSLSVREKAFTEMERALRNNTRPTSPRARLADDAAPAYDTWLADATSATDELRASLKDERLKQNGPTEMDDILKEGGPKLRAQEKKLAQLIATVEEDEANRDSLADYWADLKSRRDALGPEVNVSDNDDGTQRQENIERRWLDDAIKRARANISDPRVKLIHKAGFPNYVPANNEEMPHYEVEALKIKHSSTWDPGDAVLSEIYAIQGFDGLPRNATEEELQELVAAGGIYTTRNVSDYNGMDYMGELKNGKYYAGTGVYGNGTYTTPMKSYTANYGDTRVHMVIAADAKIGDYTQLKRDMNNDPDWRNDWRADVGRYAASKGYDAYIVAPHENGFHENFYVVLNRTAVAIGPKLTGRDAKVMS